MLNLACHVKWTNSVGLGALKSIVPVEARFALHKAIVAVDHNLIGRCDLIEPLILSFWHLIL